MDVNLCGQGVGLGFHRRLVVGCGGGAPGEEESWKWLRGGGEEFLSLETQAAGSELGRGVGGEGEKYAFDVLCCWMVNCVRAGPGNTHRSARPPPPSSLSLSPAGGGGFGISPSRLRSLEPNKQRELAQVAAQRFITGNPRRKKKKKKRTNENRHFSKEEVKSELSHFSCGLVFLFYRHICCAGWGQARTMATQCEYEKLRDLLLSRGLVWCQLKY